MSAAHLSTQSAIARLQEVITSLEGDADLETVDARVIAIFQGKNSCDWAVEQLDLAKATQCIGVVEKVPNELHITIALIAIYVLQSPDNTFEDASPTLPLLA